MLALMMMAQAEHHKRALSHLENVFFYEDHKAGRVGVLTTNPIKHAAMELVNIMLRERRICVCKHIHSRDKKALLIRLREQLQVYPHTHNLYRFIKNVYSYVYLFLQVYSFQFKAAITTFQQDRTALSGKVGV
jgi:hypothetical protein